MEQLRDVQSYLLDRLGQVQLRAEKLRFKVDPRAAQAQRTFNALGRPLSVYLNDDDTVHTPPRMMQVKGADGSEYISVRHFEGKQLEDFEVVRHEESHTGFATFYYLLPRKFELERNQVVATITPRSLTTSIENQVRIWHELKERGLQPWSGSIEPVSNVNDQQRRTLLMQGTALYSQISRYAPELFNPDEWSVAYGSVELTGRFYYLLLGDAFYSASVSAYASRPVRNVEVYPDLAKKFNNDLVVHTSNDLYNEHQEQIDNEMFLKYGRIYILNKGTTDSSGEIRLAMLRSQTVGLRGY